MGYIKESLLFINHYKELSMDIDRTTEIQALDNLILVAKEARHALINQYARIAQCEYMDAVNKAAELYKAAYKGM